MVADQSADGKKPAKTVRKSGVRKAVKAPAFGRNRSAVELTVAALQELGRVEKVDSARVAAAQALADAVDADPGNASLWREYRAALESLRQVGDGGSDEFGKLLASLSSEILDQENT